MLSKVVSVSIFGMNEIPREGLRRILESESDFRVISSAKSIDIDVDPVPDNHMVILDLQTDVAALQTISLLRERFPKSSIVVMVDSYDNRQMALSFRNGADGYLVRSISCDPLFASLRLVIMGEKVFPSQMIHSMGDTTVPTSLLVEERLQSLSQREMEILECLVRGELNKSIACWLNISGATVKAHIKNIMKKLQVMNRLQIAMYAVNAGFTKNVPTGSTVEDTAES